MNNNKILYLRSQLAKKYMNLELEDFFKYKSSDVIYRVDNMANNVCNQIYLPLLKIISDLVIVAFILIFLSLVEFEILFTILLTIFIIFIFYDFLIKNKLLKIGYLINKYSARMVLDIQESINGFREIKSYQKEDFFIKKIIDSSAKNRKYQLQYQFISIIPKYVLEFIFIIIIVFIVIYLSLQSNMDSIIPIISTFIVGLIRLMPISNSILSSFNSIRVSKDSIDILYEDMNIQSLKYNNQVNLNFKNISLVNVSFGYNGKDKVIKNKNSTINKSDRVVISGASGKGKSTFVDIVAGNLHPTSGKIYINNKNHHSFKIKDLGYVSQKNFLLNDTIKNNIILNSKFNKKKYEKVINLTKLNENLDDQSINSEKVTVGEHGSKISGGQLQKISIARALYHGKKLLILDEATNALDSKSEYEILNNLIKDKSITLIVITHRKSQIYKNFNKNLII